MLDPKIWVPQFDDDARALAIGEASSVEFSIGALDLLLLSSFHYSNTDDVAHRIQLILRYDTVSEQDLIYDLSVAAADSRMIYPQRTIASAGPSITTSRAIGVLSGPVTFIFRNVTVANIAHTPRFFSRWLQARSTMALAPVAISDVIV